MEHIATIGVLPIAADYRSSRNDKGKNMESLCQAKRRSRFENTIRLCCSMRRTTGTVADSLLAKWATVPTLIAAMAAIALSLDVDAQPIPPGQFSLGGIPVNCGPIWTDIEMGVGDAARAVPGAIIIDAQFLQQAPLPVQLFVYAHECGHHNIGMDEAGADCWAVKVGRQQGWFDQVMMQYLVQTFQWNPGDWTHAPGPVRLQNIWSCYVSP
jgi:hypothetical protein